jgi:hypothetical protein
MKTITQSNNQVKQVQNVIQTLKNSAYRDALKQLKSFDGRITKKLTAAFLKLKIGYYNVIGAGTGLGKTHHLIQIFNQIMYTRGVRLSFIIAPENILTSEESLNKHIKVLRQKLGGNLDVSYSPNISQIRMKLKARDKDEMLLFVISDKKFNMLIDDIKFEIIKHNLVGKTFFSFDECHISASSDAANTGPNNGLDDPSAECIKFNNISKILDISYVLGVSATLVKEQIDPNFGSDKYQLLNPEGFSKDEISMVVSGHRFPILYEEHLTTREQDLMQYLGHVQSEQLRYETMHNSYIGGKTYIDENGVTKFADDLLRKLTGIVILETQYKNKPKEDIAWIKDFMNQPTMTIPSNWDFDFAVDTSKETCVWRFRNGKIIELSRTEQQIFGYDNTNSLVASLSDKDSKLKFLALVGKGSIGMDVLPLNFLLSLRTFTNKYLGIPVTTRAQQILGRCRRLVIPAEDLVPFFDDVEEFIRYYITINSFQAFLPNKEYWISAQSEIDKKYPSDDDIAEIIRRAVGKC